MYTYIHMHMCMHMHMYMHRRIHANACEYTRIHACEYTHAYTYIYYENNTCECMRIHVSDRTHKNTPIQGQIHTGIVFGSAHARAYGVGQCEGRSARPLGTTRGHTTRRILLGRGSMPCLYTASDRASRSWCQHRVYYDGSYSLCRKI